MKISKNQINLIRKLHQAKGRAEYKLCIAEGAKLVNELLLYFPDEITVYALPDCMQKLHIPGNKNHQLCSVDELELSKISALKNPPGILATIPIPIFSSEPGLSEKILWLDGIRDPGNMGTLIRTAEWFGFGEIWCTSGCVDPFSPKVIQSAMGSVFRLPAFSLNHEQLNRLCSKEGRIVFGADTDGEDCKKFDKVKRFSLLIGNEGQGISESVQPYITKKISVPKHLQSPFPESLNAASAASILMFSLTF
ncbi:MAG: hypothetical protein RLZZ46_94 [Bacteroidota bacterium]